MKNLPERILSVFLNSVTKGQLLKFLLMLSSLDLRPLFDETRYKRLDGEGDLRNFIKFVCRVLILVF